MSILVEDKVYKGVAKLPFFFQLEKYFLSIFVFNKCSVSYLNFKRKQTQKENVLC